MADRVQIEQDTTIAGAVRHINSQVFEGGLWIINASLHAAASWVARIIYTCLGGLAETFTRILVPPGIADFVPWGASEYFNIGDTNALIFDELTSNRRAYFEVHCPEGMHRNSEGNEIWKAVGSYHKVYLAEVKEDLYDLADRIDFSSVRAFGNR